MVPYFLQIDKKKSFFMIDMYSMYVRVSNRTHKSEGSS
jgi:hypothetical protein